jgi:hypothetical protein
MTTITQQAQQAELALAAYATLASGDPKKDDLRNAGFSSLQADQFIKQYTVIAQYNGTGVAAGLSATVFEDKTTHIQVIGTGYGIGRFPNATEQTNYFAENGINVTTNSCQPIAFTCNNACWRATA